MASQIDELVKALSIATPMNDAGSAVHYPNWIGNRHYGDIFNAVDGANERGIKNPKFRMEGMPIINNEINPDWVPSTGSTGWNRVAGPFTPQGNTGGGVNLPGRLSDGKPAVQRSEGTDYARAARELQRAHNQPYSLIGAMIHPDQASFVDAIRRREFAKQAATGYDYRNQPGGAVPPPPLWPKDPFGIESLKNKK